MFMKPVSDFKSAVEVSRDAYFDHLKAKKKSDIEKYTTQRYLARSWTKKEDGTVMGMDQATADSIAKEIAQPVIDQKSFEIRRKAFDIVILYTDVLLALASDEETDALIAEIEGFKNDTEKLIDSIGDLGEFLGPFGSAVKALELIVTTISDAAREKAIRKSIINTDHMIQELFMTLGQEATLTQETICENYKTLLERLQGVIDKETFADAAAKDKVFEKYALYKGLVEKMEILEEGADVGMLFEKAREAHIDLLYQASGVGVEEFGKRIKEFRERAMLIKETLKEIHS
ncbi:MAG: hypothetical protein KJ645_11805 [Planctomycetes bacterium]|nr:hypothetical protein [Planctomycetota bacterium]